MDTTLQNDIVAIKTTQVHIEKDLHALRVEFEKHEHKDDKRFNSMADKLNDNTALLIKIDTKITASIKAFIFSVTILMPIVVVAITHVTA